MNADPSTNEGACQAASDQLIGAVVQAIETGIRDGSMRSDIGDPMLLALTLWAFMHGIIQIAVAKGTDLARRGIAIQDFGDYAFQWLRSAAESKPAI